ncbi:endonuclease MutS2 [Geitlerinema sp. PCC 9228]|uniref:endonuclease MutS2 n=1 Tax=Geitlerinema sp. PCC 9228 TaxID=111611 RepID=UPI0008F9C5B1|nr:endonuclease MutS2 [Geitlerinema sp. PCC 9228]
MALYNAPAETLELLEWSRLCQHLATFAATKLGAIAARQLPIPETQEQSQHLLTQTKEASDIERLLPNGLQMGGITDVGDAIERVQRQGILSAEELYAIATTLAGARNLRRTIDAIGAADNTGIGTESDRPVVLQQVVAQLRTYPEIEQGIRHCIEEGGKIADRASPHLGGIRQKQRQLRQEIEQKLRRIMQRQAAAVQEQYITQRGDRYVLPVKATHKEAIAGIVHDTSTTGATLYVEPHAVVNANNQARQLAKQEQTEIERILSQLSDRIREIAEDIERLLAIVTEVDLAYAKARYSIWLQANPPQFADREAETQVKLRQLRHPLLVWQQDHEHGPAVVPVDVQVRSPICSVVITGPNTGGKTVTLKSVGLAALMAKCGLFVPAQDPAVVPWFDLVLADIGDEQSLEQSLSTFSGHVRRIAEIFETMTQNSLVLLDEVGAGTDPTEGSALATALLKHLANTVHLSIATTHFGELKTLKYQDERFENASVEFDEETLSPTYRLLWGIPGRSMALTIARRLGLQASVVDEAKNLVGTGTASENMNQVLEQMEKQRAEQETKAAEAAEMVRRAEQLHEEVSRKAQDLRERESALRQNAEATIAQTVADAKEEIAKVIRELQQGPAKTKGQQAQKATEAIDRIAAKHISSKPAKKPAGFEPKPGMKVRIPTGQTCEIMKVEPEEEQVTVRFGMMKLTVSMDEIESLEGEKVAKPEPPPSQPVSSRQSSSSKAASQASGSIPKVRTESNTLDLRGRRVEEATMELDRELGQRSGGALWIIHGKGTGKLRAGVHEFLQQHPQIEHYELAPDSEGGIGVTIAHLK